MFLATIFGGIPFLAVIYFMWGKKGMPTLEGKKLYTLIGACFGAFALGLIVMWLVFPANAPW